MTTYSVQEAFNKLQALKITSNEESVRRWLRTGKLKGYQQSKKTRLENNSRGSSALYRSKTTRI